RRRTRSSDCTCRNCILRRSPCRGRSQGRRGRRSQRGRRCIWTWCTFRL
ncbi:uncharacterized protein METZ01_LOCUS259822, partial [marine metagenome]